MKKPKIEVNEVGAMGPDGIELKIGDLTFFCKKYAEAQAIEEIIDALIDSYKAIESLPDDALGKVRPPDRFEEYAVKYELIHNIRKALKKAGCE